MAAHHIAQYTHQAEQEKAKADALFSGIGDGAIATDENGRVGRINKIALELLGFEEEGEIIGEWYPKVIIAENEEGKSIPPIDRPITQALLSGKPVSKELVYVRKDGSKLPVALTVSPILINDRPVGAIEVFRDITREKQVEEAKDEFLSITSHQLRTPLTAIRLFTEMMLGGQVGKLNKEQREYLDNIEQSALRMIQLVGATLNISRIELGRLKVDPKPTDLEDLAESLIKEVKPLAEQRHIRIKLLPVAKDLPEANIDPALLGEVVHNLLTNAVRYSLPNVGKVEVGVQHTPRGFEISVKDNGIGIPAGAQKKLFTRFYRADNAVEAAGDGTGLGLYLIRMIMDTTGGTVTYTSKENVGTTFFVRIPNAGMKARVGDKGLSA